MQNYIIVTSEGSTMPPNFMSSNQGVENLQVLGFACGNNKEEAVRSFRCQNIWLENTGFSEAMAFVIGEDLENFDFRTFTLKQ